MIVLTPAERSVCAAHFLTHHLSSRERMLVAAFALGHTPAHIARSWSISRAAVTQMARRIREKAEIYWQ
jgi:DNA-binding CsgD family transcriptional regulator